MLSMYQLVNMWKTNSNLHFYNKNNLLVFNNNSIDLRKLKLEIGILNNFDNSSKVGYISRFTF